MKSCYGIVRYFLKKHADHWKAVFPFRVLSPAIEGLKFYFCFLCQPNRLCIEELVKYFYFTLYKGITVSVWRATILFLLSKPTICLLTTSCIITVYTSPNNQTKHASCSGEFNTNVFKAKYSGLGYCINWMRIFGCLSSWLS